MAESESMKNYRNYNSGKAKLQNAVLLQPDDKINAFIKSKIDHRFWIKDYNKFKADINSDVPAQGIRENLNEDGEGGASPGAVAIMGNPVAPTPTSNGSGDKFTSDKKKKKKVNKYKAKMFEGFFSGDVETFEDTISSHDLSLYNEPAELGEVDSSKAHVTYSAEIEANRSAIEGIIFTIKTIRLDITTIKYSPEDKDGDNPIEDDKTIELHNPEVNIEKHQLPFYITNISIDMKKTMDQKYWKIDMEFGRQSRY